MDATELALRRAVAELRQRVSALESTVEDLVDNVTRLVRGTDRLRHIGELVARIEALEVAIAEVGKDS